MNRSPGKLCLIEDDPIMGESLSHRFSLEDMDYDWFKDGRSAIRAICENDYGVVVSDIRLPDVNGEELYDLLLERCHQIPPVIFITGYGSIDQAVRLLKKGARDYITKPFDLDDLLNKLRFIDPDLFAREGEAAHEPELGISPAMRRIEEILREVAGHKASVLITGESGVGKEYAARYVHQSDRSRQDRPFIAINCAALPEELLEAELFGYEKGAFTGATRSRAGVFRKADKGTLFLDEVGEMSAAMQAKLLRAIQEGTIQPLGSDDTEKVDVRLICATNRDLKKSVRTGEFREDLFYRINVIHVEIPPLRKREEDIIWFARLFVEEYSRQHSVHRFLPAISQRYLKAQPWPGNIRELHHFIERACILAQQEILGPRELGLLQEEESPEEEAMSLKLHMEKCEARMIRETLNAHQWKISETAASLGISRKNLWEKMKRYCIEEDKH